MTVWYREYSKLYSFDIINLRFLTDTCHLFTTAPLNEIYFIYSAWNKVKILRSCSFNLNFIAATATTTERAINFPKKSHTDFIDTAWDNFIWINKTHNVQHVANCMKEQLANLNSWMIFERFNCVIGQNLVSLLIQLLIFFQCSFKKKSTTFEWNVFPLLFCSNSIELMNAFF